MRGQSLNSLKPWKEPMVERAIMGGSLQERLGNEDELRRYKQRYEGYALRIDWTNSEPYNPRCELLDVILTTRDNQNYWASFTTLPYLEAVFRKNRQTGEQLAGTYFGMPDNMVILGLLTEENIRKTIDDLINNQEVEFYFKNVD